MVTIPQLPASPRLAPEGGHPGLVIEARQGRMQAAKYPSSEISARPHRSLTFKYKIFLGKSRSDHTPVWGVAPYRISGVQISTFHCINDFYGRSARERHKLQTSQQQHNICHVLKAAYAVDLKLRRKKEKIGGRVPSTPLQGLSVSPRLESYFCKAA